MMTFLHVRGLVLRPDGEVHIAIAGKYTGLQDAYKSLSEALVHGGIANNVKVNLHWIESEVFEKEDPAPWLEQVNGILVPGGFGERGTEGKILAARFARERKVPYFGICFGMQMAVIEAARNLCHLPQASSSAPQAMSCAFTVTSRTELLGTVGAPMHDHVAADEPRTDDRARTARRAQRIGSGGGGGYRRQA